MNLLNEFLIEKNNFISRDIRGFYRLLYYGWKDPRTPKFILHFKNRFKTNSIDLLKKAKNELLSRNRFYNEIIEIIELFGYPMETISVCIVPRSKVRNELGYTNGFDKEKSLFFYTVQGAIRYISECFKYDFDGSEYIIRHTNTRTTHLNKSGNGGDGDMPYPGIANDTCYFSPEIQGRNIVLIDDLYTKTINIIEDMAQALLDHGANDVIVFSIAYTANKNLGRQNEIY